MTPSRAREGSAGGSKQKGVRMGRLWGSRLGRALLASVFVVALFAPGVAQAIESPANDAFAAAEIISGAIGTLDGANIGATVEAGEPDESNGSSVWYSWTAPQNGLFVFDTLGSNYDTVLGVYMGDTVDGLTTLDVNDDTYRLQSRVEIEAVEGETYMVSVRGFSGNQGSFTLNWRLRLEAASDAFEPDDTLFEAPLVDPDGGASLHSMYPDNDVDCIKIPVKAGHVYRANIMGLEYGWFDADVSFYDGDGDLAEWGNSFVAAEDGYAYVRVAPYYFDSYNCWYNISITEELPASVSGIVRADDTKVPLEGVTVELIRLDDGWWDWEDSTRTSTSGAYAFEGISAQDGPYKLYFAAWNLPDYLSEYFDDARWEGAKEIVLTGGENYVANADLARAGKVNGSVTDEDTGEPLGGIEVRVYAYTGSSGYDGLFGTETDASGHFDLGNLDPELPYLVRFSDYSSSYASEWYNNTEVYTEAQQLVVPAGETQTLNAELALRAEVGHIRGKVLDRATGEPVQEVRVTYVSGTEGMPDYSSGYLGWTDSSGRYSRGGLDTARPYKIRFADPQSGYAVQYFNDKPDAASADEITLAAGAWFTANANLDLDSSKGVVQGIVTADDTLELMTRGSVGALSYNDMSGYWNWEREASVNDDGSYIIRGLEAGREYAIWAWGQPNYETSSYLGEYYSDKSTADAADKIVLTAGEQRTLNFGLAPGAHISGTVTEDGTGLPIKNLEVALYESRGVSGYEWIDSVTTNSTGAYDLWDLNPTKQYKLGFHDNSKGIWVSEYYSDKPGLDLADELPLVAGDNTINAQLERSSEVGSISGTVSDAYAHAGTPFVQVDLIYVDGEFGASGYWGRAHTKADGTYRFDGLPKSLSYKIKFSDPYGGPRYATEYFNGKPDFASADTLVFGEEASSLITNATFVPLAGEDALPILTDDAKVSYNDSAVVNFSATDAGSGLKAMYYTFDGSDVITDSDGIASVSTSVLAEHTLVYWAEDNLGNMAEQKTVVFSVVDGTGPLVSAQVAPAANADGWRKAPAAVTLTASDPGTGVDEVTYRIGSGAITPYTVPFMVPEGVVAVTFSATDNAGNASVPQVVTVKSDATAPSIPSGVTYSAITNTTVTLMWNASTDDGSGVGAYKVYKDGVFQAAVTSPSYKVTGLALGSSANYAVLAVDNLGQQSALSPASTIAQPTVSGTGDVTGTGSQFTDITVPDLGTVHVDLSGVTSPGQVRVTMTTEPPAGADADFKFMGLYFDIDFSGAAGSFTITMPYDASIPDARALNLKIKHFTGGHWETIVPTVDLVNHKLTFTVTSLSPFAYAEAADVNNATTLATGFGSATSTTAEKIVAYGSSATLVGKLRDASSAGLAHKTVVVERYDYTLKTWVKVGNAAAGTTAGEYRYTVRAYGGNRTPFRMRFAGDTYNTESSSLNRTVMPNTYVRTPIAPKTMSRTKYYSVYGYLKPKHTAGSYPVRIYKWKKTSTGKWKRYGYVTAKASNYSSYTKYSKKLKLGSAGKWRLRAYTPKDGQHAATWSSSYDYVTVR